MPAQEEEEGAEVEVLDDVEELEIEKELLSTLTFKKVNLKVGDLIFKLIDDQQQGYL